ncbi:MAG: hypothetical protein WBI07_18875 [Mobilitalea sp.]
MKSERIGWLFLIVCLQVLLITGCTADNSEVQEDEYHLNNNLQLSNTMIQSKDEVQSSTDNNDIPETDKDVSVTNKDEMDTNNDESVTDKIDSNEIPKDISLEEAKEEGMLVLEGMAITSGGEEWNAFYHNVQSGKEDEILIAKYYELDDESHYSPEYYQEIKDDYPILYIFLLSYDGSSYTMSHYEGTQLLVYEYDYLVERVGHLTSNAAMAEHFFALTNDKKLSYHDISWSMFSSQSTDWVDFKYVFNESVVLTAYFSRQPGTYITENGLASLTLTENCEFTFNRYIATNYDPSGRYYVEGDILILYVNEEEEYRFRIMGDSVLEFISGDMAEGLVEKGTEFLYQQTSE